MAERLRIFFYALVLNLIWENLHHYLYASYRGGAITGLVLARAAAVDALIISAVIYLAQTADFFKKRPQFFIVVSGLVIAAAIEKWALGTGRWQYGPAMPLLPVLGIGLTPFVQLAFTGWLTSRISNKLKQMKKNSIPLAGFIFGAILVSNIAFVLPARAAEKINDFAATIKINTDASLQVSEKIIYDFGEASKHGIYRDIPYKYKNARGNFKLDLSGFSVVDENGAPYAFSLETSGNDKRVKIGDPDRLVTGAKIYIVSYRVGRAINYFTDHDELYWNVTGNGWTADISSARARVILPRALPADKLPLACYAGPFGSQTACSSASLLVQDGKADTAEFGQNELAAGDGLTIVFGFPKGIVAEPALTDELWQNAKDNGIVVLPILVFLAMFYLWYSRGRDPKGRGTIIAQFDAPDGLTPAEVGTIIDERADSRDITADIIYLATKGYLKIRQTETAGILLSEEDYELEKLKAWQESGNEPEKKLLFALFKGRDRVKLSELKNTFYQDMHAIRGELYTSAVSKGYFRGNPRSVRALYLIVGATVAVFGPVFSSLGYLFAASFILAGIVIAAFGLIMPARTKKGVETREYLLGLKEYLSVAERDRLRFHNAPEAKPERFEKLLPYAMVFGVEKEWAKQFEGIYKENPAWFEGRPGIAWNAALLATSLNNFSTKAVHTLAASAASHGSGLGGGGFSGGGFGGGGGGSW